MNIGVIDRPNGVAVFEVLGIYLDVMRPFIVQKMPVFNNGTATAQELIRDSIPIEMRRDFDQQVVSRDDVSLAIEVTHIPHIVSKNWELSFAREFGQEKIYITRMEALAKSRNLVCHPAAEDVSTKQAESALYCVEKIATQIERHDARERVSRVRQRLEQGCCTDCPESNLQIDPTGQEDLQREMCRMQGELDALSKELYAYRSKPEQSRKSAVVSQLGRVVPRVWLHFSVGFGGGPEPDHKSALHRPPEEVIPELEPSPADSNGHQSLADRASTDRGSASQAVR